MSSAPGGSCAVVTAPMLAGDLAAATAAEASTGGMLGAWRRAWIAQAAGRYGDALAELAVAERGDPVLTGAAFATRASVLRQIGLHQRAQRADDAGLAVLAAVEPPEGDTVTGSVPSPAASVRAALRIGLVADAVGEGDGAELAARLDAAQRAVATAADPRHLLRLEWVRGEVALVGGDAVTAGAAFATAGAMAREAGWVRHSAKSALLEAGAAMAAGEIAHADALATTVLDQATTCGARPLSWPALLIRAEVRARRHPAGVDALLDDARDSLVPLLAGLPRELRAEASSRDPIRSLLGRSSDGDAEGAESPYTRPTTSMGEAGERRGDTRRGQ